ncbi:hypothetical protein ACJX0J_026331, partial [Zea mays]
LSSDHFKHVMRRIMSKLAVDVLFAIQIHENASNINFTSFKEMGILWKHRHWPLIIFFSNNFTHMWLSINNNNVFIMKTTFTFRLLR